MIPTLSPYGWEPAAADYPLMLQPLHGRSSQGQVVARPPQAYHAALDARGAYIAHYARKTSFTSMGSQVRVLLRPPPKDPDIDLSLIHI